MDVRGRAVLMPGNKVVLQLEPQRHAGQQPGTPPVPEVVIQQIADGTLLVHPTKATITARRIQMQICNIQRGFRLAVGANGGWTGDAQTKFLQWLLKSEQKRARTASSPSPCPALEDEKAQKMLALEDKKDVESLPGPVPAMASSGPAALNVEDQDRGEHLPDPAPVVAMAPAALTSEDHDLDERLPHPAPVVAMAPAALTSEDHDLDEHSPGPAAAMAMASAPAASIPQKHSSSSSSSSSTSSASRKLRKSRARIREAKAALQEILPIVSEACGDCATNLKHVQQLLDNAM